MNAFEKLLALSEAEKEKLGIQHTPPEIAQQPSTWMKAAQLLVRRRDEILEFMRRAGLYGDAESVLLLTGAGTSEFVGNAIAPALRPALRREVLSIPTTTLVTHAAELLVPGHGYVLLSFARSGNSPESAASCALVQRACPELYQIVVTCNADGELARQAAGNDRTLCLVLPEETNDRSLAMTSSFSTMAMTGLGLGLLEGSFDIPALAGQLGQAAERIIAVYGDMLYEFSRLDFVRACYLGSGTLTGAMQECHLKMQEMTEGRVAARFDSFLGVRHGPQVFVDDRCVVVAGLATDPAVRRYEMDLLRELKAKGQGCGTLVICDRATPELRDLTRWIVELYPDGGAVQDAYRVMTDVVVGQILATFTSMKLGLKPDNPSTSGTINRVVKGVTIYDPA